MEYFLGRDEIAQVAECDIADIKPVAEFNIRSNEDDFYNEPVVKNNTIICQNRTNTVKKFVYQGTNSLLTNGNFLESSEETIVSWENRIQLFMGKESTLLSILDADNNFIKFDNGKDYLHFNHAFDEITNVEHNENYLVLVTGDGFEAKSKNGIKYYQMVENPSFLVLIDISKDRTNEKSLKEVCRKNLKEVSYGFICDSIIFSKTSSKILLVSEMEDPILFVTFDTSTQRICSKGFLNADENEMIAKYTSVFYGYHSIFKDIIVVINSCTRILTVLKELSLERSPYLHGDNGLQDGLNGLHICKQTELQLEHKLEKIRFCVNRSNQFILFLYCSRSDMKEICLYDVFNAKLMAAPIWCDGAEVFTNPSGEEVFCVEKNKLKVYVYKSQVKNLKEICRIVVKGLFSKRQLEVINLPKHILDN